MSIGANIKNIREKRGFSQVKFAEAVGVSQAMICQIERGGKIPSLATIKMYGAESTISKLPKENTNTERDTRFASAHLVLTALIIKKRVQR